MYEEDSNAESHCHLLGEDNESKLSSEDSLPLFAKSPKRRRRWFYQLPPVIGGVLAFAIYSFLLVFATSKVTQRQRVYGTKFIESPIHDFITYEPRTFQLSERPGVEPTYFTEPSPEVDAKWHELFEHQNIGVSPETMKKLGRLEEGVKLPDGSYYGSLMVFHHLHCLKNIYHALHPEYYNPTGLSEKEKKLQDVHLAHCLHLIKDGLMCQADPTLFTMRWVEYELLPVHNMSSTRECVNWDRFMEGVMPISRDVMQDGVLVHPKYGPVFKDRQPVKWEGSPSKSEG